jgi:hypothetical protein
MLLADPKGGRNGKGTSSALYSPWPESQQRDRLYSMGIHTVFCASGSLYQHWGVELLVYSHRKTAQPGPLAWLLSSCEGLIREAGLPALLKVLLYIGALGDDQQKG